MSDAQVLEIVIDGLTVATKLAAPVLIVTLVIGVAVSIVQTVTQIQEQSLSFVPKLIGAAGVLVLGGHWMLQEVVSWVTRLWASIPELV